MTAPIRQLHADHDRPAWGAAADRVGGVVSRRRRRIVQQRLSTPRPEDISADLVYRDVKPDNVDIASERTAWCAVWSPR